MRIVPASTSRKNAATIVGTTTKTPRSTAAMMKNGLVIIVWRSITTPFAEARAGLLSDSRALERHSLGSDRPDSAAIALGVDVVDANRIAGAHADACFGILRPQRAYHLNNLP